MKHEEERGKSKKEEIQWTVVQYCSRPNKLKYKKKSFKSYLLKISQKSDLWKSFQKLICKFVNHSIGFDKCQFKQILADILVYKKKIETSTNNSIKSRWKNEESSFSSCLRFQLKEKNHLEGDWFLENFENERRSRLIFFAFNRFWKQ